jgi:hypothetical protein
LKSKIQEEDLPAKVVYIEKIPATDPPSSELSDSDLLAALGNRNVVLSDTLILAESSSIDRTKEYLFIGSTSYLKRGCERDFSDFIDYLES